ncbi:MAG TPA: UDP-2,3-diacylglucosamine diphosphatase [Steroidobacteraceae bacterium]|nr:UDP-2,3-diacylglucosamine diphosphatase [Steroidobacteraceae bacterium]
MTHLFVSDVHLGEDSAPAIGQFLGFLTTRAARAETLYILGDLFESWVGDDDRSPAALEVCAALKGLTAGGVPCFVLHGNRDFLLGSGFCERTGCVLLSDPVVAELDGEQVLVTHGDALCTDDHSYQELRSIVRSPRMQRRFLALPLERRELLAGEVRAGSRRHIARTVPTIMDVNAGAVERAFRVTGVRRMIHGHTHRPGVHDLTIDGASAQRIVLGAWYEEGCYLSCERGSYALNVLPREQAGG